MFCFHLKTVCLMTPSKVLNQIYPLYNNTKRLLLISIIFQTKQTVTQYIQHLNQELCFAQKKARLINFINKFLIISMTYVKKSKAKSCLHAIRQGQSRLNFQKYVVIDSQNEDEVINIRHYDSFQNINQVLLTQEKRSVILKSKGSTVTNFLSNPSYPDLWADTEINSAEKQVKSLQRECQLLENMITDMIEVQSKLTVQLRKRERAQSLNNQFYDNKQCEYVSCQVSLAKQNSLETIEGIMPKRVNVAVKEPLSITTPLFSKNIEKPHKKGLQIVKTVEIKNLSKPKKGKENQTSKKLSHMKKKSVSKVKQINKSQNSICKIGTKAKAY